MGPLDVIKESDLADKVGWVDIDPTTMQHKIQQRLLIG